MQPLQIQAIVGRHNLQQIHRTLQLAHRIGSIHLDSSLHHIHGLLDTLAHPNPALESMTVTVNTAGHGVQGQVYPPPSYPLVGPSLPAMKYLELHSTPFYLISERYISLTDLHVHDLTPCQRPTLQQFLSTLSKFSHLEHLTLENAFPLVSNSIPFPQADSPSSSPSTSPPGSPPQKTVPLVKRRPSPFQENRISLPRLSTLRLSGSITEIATVLDSLMLPPDVSLTCAVTCLQDWQQSMPRLAEALSVHSFAAASGGCPLQRLVISGLEEAAYPPAMAGVVYGGVHNGVAPMTVKGVRIRGFAPPPTEGTCSSSKRARSPVRPGTPSTSSRAQVPLLDLTIGPDSDPDFSSDEVIIRALTYVWRSLSLGSVHSLVLHDLDTVTQKAWTQFLKTLPSLRVLDITGHAPSGFIWALLLNAVACIQREERERERREKREKKALKIFQDAAAAAGRRPNSPESPPHSPLPPTSPLSPTPSSSRRLFVPRLADIYLHGVDCTSGGYMVAPDAHVNSEWDLDDSRFLDVLLACLQMRSQAASAAAANSMSGMPMPTSMKLRSMSISNCRGVPRQTALLFREFVSHSVWDQRGMLKDGEDTGLARYRKVGVLGNGRDELRHYYRLKTLLDELDF
ncbi:hypothetical protein EST38_g417 [Candolleomyces aberdarensis]|uniref:Uncharacterized protein n=1 Tax=Candolleomyces aberdarensis TaxID=2316362 RepID=A0A4Q2DYF6_9AGAR|nr:hypothetical protein EST38_g417 [Candolleomyces aberdarensis]